MTEQRDPNEVKEIFVRVCRESEFVYFEVEIDRLQGTDMLYCYTPEDLRNLLDDEGFEWDHPDSARHSKNGIETHWLGERFK